MVDLTPSLVLKSACIMNQPRGCDGGTMVYTALSFHTACIWSCSQSSGPTVSLQDIKLEQKSSVIVLIPGGKQVLDHG
jgi:hypothetical protein